MRVKVWKLLSFMFNAIFALSAVYESAPRTAYKLFAAYPLHKEKVGNL
jgi:hypothetical protein